MTNIVTPHSLKDAPALIEKAWPTSKISAETQKERKAGSGQTLTGLGSYWKGRKPLILTRALVLASLMPATDDLARDIEIFEKLMGFDDQGMLRRLPAKMADFVSSAPYNDRVLAAKRPEEISEVILLEGVWDEVNAHLNTDASSIKELVEQLGVMRFGHRPKLADTFSGSGSIPFEAARMGCEVYASDLNPVACMLTWGAFNIVGAAPEDHARMKAEQEDISARIDREICEMGIEHDSAGNRAKVYLYCLETRCPRTGYMVPMAPSWVISKKRNVIAKLVPDHDAKRYDIEIVTGVTVEEMATAAEGTVRKGRLYHDVLDDPMGVAISEIRGDYKDPTGKNRNGLRLWEKSDVRPREDDIWQERLYAIQWMDAAEILEGKAHPTTWFAAPTAEDLVRETEVAAIVGASLADWHEQGIVPDMEIEPGNKTEEPIRTRGWTHWHHLFNPRHLLVNALISKHSRVIPHSIFGFASVLDKNARTALWHNGRDTAEATFMNQSLNCPMNYATRSYAHCKNLLKLPPNTMTTHFTHAASCTATGMEFGPDIIVTDPPYADAVQYDEITEYFIAWLRKNPPAPFDQWVWDSRRHMAIKGEGQSFKVSMIEAYRSMTAKMSDNGLQIVQFTHQDAKTWSDMANIFWGSGLQVAQDWYVSTETMNGLKSEGYVQGTHMIVLRKRQGDESGYSDDILGEIEAEVALQIQEMLGLNQSMTEERDENIFNDADLQMAGYAAALRVLTRYTKIDGMDMVRESSKERKKGERTLVDELTEYAVQVANDYLVPEGLTKKVWKNLTKTERYYLRMADMESGGPVKLENFTNFAKAFRVENLDDLMASKKPNASRLKLAVELGTGSMGEGEFGKTSVVRLALRAIMRVQKGGEKNEIDKVISELHDLLPDYYRKKELLETVVSYLAEKRRDVSGVEATAAQVLEQALRVEKI